MVDIAYRKVMVHLSCIGFSSKKKGVIIGELLYNKH